MKKKVFRSLILVCLISICNAKNIQAEYKKSGKPEFSFGVIADVQYCDCEHSESRYYRSSLRKLKECVQDFNSKDLAFVIQLGDFIDRDYASFDKVLPIYHQLKMPKYHVLGNHDFSIEQEEKGKVLEKIVPF